MCQDKFTKRIEIKIVDINLNELSMFIAWNHIDYYVKLFK